MREPLLTQRLELRDMTCDDARLLADLDSDAEVMRFIGNFPLSEPAVYRERIQSVYIPWQSHAWHGIRIVLDRGNGDFLGWVFIRPATLSRLANELGWTRPDEVEIGYRFHRSAWGRGIATEAAMPLVQTAFADPATRAVVACAMAANTRSLRVLRKLGLEPVGEVMGTEPSEPIIKLSRDRQA